MRTMRGLLALATAMTTEAQNSDGWFLDGVLVPDLATRDATVSLPEALPGYGFEPMPCPVVSLSGGWYEGGRRRLEDMYGPGGMYGSGGDTGAGGGDDEDMYGPGGMYGSGGDTGAGGGDDGLYADADGGGIDGPPPPPPVAWSASSSFDQSGMPAIFVDACGASGGGAAGGGDCLSSSVRMLAVDISRSHFLDLHGIPIRILRAFDDGPLVTTCVSSDGTTRTAGVNIQHSEFLSNGHFDNMNAAGGPAMPGAIDVVHSVVTIRDCRFVDNYGNAGAIRLYASILTVDFSLFKHNGGASAAATPTGGIHVKRLTQYDQQMGSISDAEFNAMGLVLRHCAFVGNQGERGSGMSSFGSVDHVRADDPGMFFIYNTSFDCTDDTRCLSTTAGWVSVNVLAGCQQYPCNPGHACSYSSYSLMCTPCQGATVSPDGLVCNPCPAGEGPTADSRSCTSCAANEYSAVGICMQCEAGKVPLPSRTGCVACDPGMVVLDGQCVCAEGKYNSSFGLIFCFAQDYSAAVIDSVDYNTMRVEYEARQQCLTCPECVACAIGNSPTIQPGYSLSPQGLEIWGQDLDVDSSPFYDEPDFRRASGHDVRQVPRSLFLCGVGGQACERNTSARTAVTSRRILMRTASQSNVQCRPGHTGALCGACAGGYFGTFGELCAACVSSSWVTPVIAAVSFVVLVPLLYRRILSKAQDAQLRLDTVRAKYALARQALAQARKVHGQAHKMLGGLTDDEGGALQATLDTAKVILGNLQIITQFPVTLKFNCPGCTRLRELLASLPAINIDFFNSFKVGCMGGGFEFGLFGKFVFTIVSPLVVLVLLQVWAHVGGAAVGVQQSHQKESLSVRSRHTKAREISFWIIFLIYPTISTTIFSVFACRDMDFGQAWHVYDSNMDCNSSEYMVLWVCALLALFLIPVGVPCLFGFLLYKNRVALSYTGHTGFSYEVFVTTARSLLNNQESFSDKDLRAIYEQIDVDGSGEVSSEELWKFALARAVCGDKQNGLKSLAANADVPDDRFAHGNSNQKRAWWEGGPEEFRFLVRAYEAEYFWFELVSYLKKFILSGVLVFAQPGSTAQLYLAALVSFYFFALLARTMPFKNPETDRSAVVAEANLFCENCSFECPYAVTASPPVHVLPFGLMCVNAAAVTIMCLLMLKINLTGEFLEQEFYDTAIAASNACAAGIPIVLASALAVRRLASEWIDSRSAPLDSGDIVRVMICPDNYECCGLQGKVVRSNPDLTVDVEVRVQTGGPSSCGAVCKKSQHTVEIHTLFRGQVQLLPSKIQSLKLVAGVCKELFMCGKAIQGQQAELDEDTQPSPKHGEEDLQPHEELADLLIEPVVDDDEMSLRQLGLASLRSVLEPTLAKKDLTWEEVETMISGTVSAASRLQEALADPEAFIAEISALLARLGTTKALNRLRPRLEPLLAARGMSWDEELPRLEERIDLTMETLESAMENPEAFLTKLLVDVSAVATKEKEEGS